MISIFNKSYDEFLNDLAARESGGDYQNTNTFDYLGKYQMGEAALVDAGYYTKDGTGGKYQDWIGTWTGKDGVSSREDFLNNAAAQENAIRSYMEKQWKYIETYGLDKYIGTRVDGIEITASGLLAAAHLKGAKALERFLKSGGKGKFKDAYGTDGREYLKKFAGYDVPFDETSLSEAINYLFNKMRDFYNSIKSLFSKAEITTSPIALDLDGNGIATTNVKDGAYFDHDANGFTAQTGWVSPDDGLLVRDINNDGIINDGTELFGNQTILSNGQKASNGFQALSELDENKDGKVDVNDSAYSQLKIWQDIDGDGYSSEDELMSLEDAGIESINTGYADANITDANGNTIKQAGSFTFTDGSTSAASDVWFKTDNMYTIANEWLDVPEDIAELPDLQGYGNVYDLQQAMAREQQAIDNGQEVIGNTLKQLVEQFMNETDAEDFMKLAA